MCSRPPSTSARRRGQARLGLGANRQIVVDERDLTVEREDEARIALEQIDRFVENLDELGAEGLERLVPLTVPVGVRDERDAGERHGASVCEGSAMEQAVSRR
jgi:hypothetical protein